MEYINRNGKKISRMTLGSAQLGMNYGIANNTGKPSAERCAEMLRFAREAGITSIDTAGAYGDSETLLGKYLSDTEANSPPPYITTKIQLGFGKPTGGGVTLPADDLNTFRAGFDALGDGAEKTVFDLAEASLDRLKIRKADCIMLHSPYEMAAGGARLARIMGRLVTAGYADEVGVSLYLPHEAGEMMKYEEYTAVQLPVSVFDQKMILSGTLRKLRQRDILVFVRSVFLQGVFFLEPESMEDPLLIEHARPHVAKLRLLAEREGISVAQMALSFVRDAYGAGSLVLGCDGIGQITENVALMDGPRIGEESMEAIKSEFGGVNIDGIMVVLRRAK